MKISFIVPAYNEDHYLGPCLESILAEAKKQEWPFEVIVINNASTDRTRQVAGVYVGVRVVDEAQKGLVYARQKGLESSTGELLAYLDADCRLTPQWFGILKRAFQNPAAVSLSGPYRYYDLSAWNRFWAEAGWWLSAPLTYRLTRYMVLGGNFVARRETLLAMGGFDRRIEFYGEDTDIARRLHQFGKVIFRMDFAVWSSGRRLASEGLFRTYLRYGLNFIWEALFHRPFTKKYRDVR